MRQTVSLINSTFTKPHTTVASKQHLENFYVELIPQAVSGSRPTTVAVGTPGSQLFLNLGNFTQIRAMIQHKGNFYALADGSCFRITQSSNVWSATLIGTVAITSGLPAFMDATLNEVVVCDGNNLYSYREDLATWQAVDPTQFTVNGVQTPVSCVIGYAGFFLYLCLNSNTIFYSNLNDGRTVQALDFFQTNGYYDNIVAMARSENYVYFMSDVGSEVWQLSGQTSTPFIRASGGILPYGLFATQAFAVSQDNVYFIACDSTGPIGLGIMNGPYVTIGAQPDLITKLNNYNNTSNSFSFIENINGHAIFNISIPYADSSPNSYIKRGRTWGIDTATGAVIERSSYNLSLPPVPDFDMYYPSCTAYAHTSIGALQVFGDYFSGNIYQQAQTTYTEKAGNPILRSVTSAHLTDQDNRFSAYNLQINFEPGQGLASGTVGNPPEVMVQYSHDFGNTWSPEVWRTVSPLGQYRYIFRMSRLGLGRVLTIKVTMTDPINWVISYMTLEVERSEPNYGRMMGLE